MRTSLCFGAAVLIIVAVFATPLALLARVYLATAFVVMNLLLNIVAPLFIVCGLPRRLAAKVRVPALVGWFAGVLSLIVWYVPTFYNAAIRSPAIGALEVATWLIAGVLFFLPFYTPARENRVRSVPPGVLYLFGIAILASVLGLRLATIQPGHYSDYLAPKDPLGILNSLQTTWQLGPDDDQQTAGFTLWLGTCSVYLWSVMLLFFRMYRGER